MRHPAHCVTLEAHPSPDCFVPPLPPPPLPPSPPPPPRCPHRALMFTAPGHVPFASPVINLSPNTAQPGVSPPPSHIATVFPTQESCNGTVQLESLRGRARCNAWLQDMEGGSGGANLTNSSHKLMRWLKDYGQLMRCICYACPPPPLPPPPCLSQSTC